MAEAPVHTAIIRSDDKTAVNPRLAGFRGRANGIYPKKWRRGGVEPPTRVGGQGLTPCCDEIATVFSTASGVPFSQSAQVSGGLRHTSIATQALLLAASNGMLSPIQGRPYRSYDMQALLRR